MRGGNVHITISALSGWIVRAAFAVVSRGVITEHWRKGLPTA